MANIPPMNSWRHFEEKRVLGVGASGIVKLVKHRQPPHSKYAIKTIPLAQLSDQLSFNVRQEVMLLRNLDHPNIIQYYDSFEEDDALHIVMEYAPGGSLGLRTGPEHTHPTDVILEWLVGLLSAMRYLHERRICHRDLKLENVFLSRKNHVKIGDFGISTILSTTRPHAQTVVGTPMYFAPELCNGEPYNEKCDVWALGVILYQLCNNGESPFKGTSLAAVINAIMNHPMALFKPHADHRFLWMCQLMLEKDPAHRPSIQQLMDSFVKLPESHPSHHLANPIYARAVQRMKGPGCPARSRESGEEGCQQNVPNPAPQGVHKKDEGHGKRPTKETFGDRTNVIYTKK